MKDEPWRGDPALRVQHLERKLGNKRKRLAQLEAGLAAANKRVAELEGVVAWLTGDDTGLSSQWMLHVCCDVPFEKGWDEGAYPYDPSDFGLCYRLIRAIPQVKANMHKLKDSGPVWAAYIEKWDQLEAAYELEYPKGDAPILHGLMKRIRSEVE